MNSQVLDLIQELEKLDCVIERHEDEPPFRILIGPDQRGHIIKLVFDDDIYLDGELIEQIQKVCRIDGIMMEDEHFVMEVEPKV